MNYNATITLRFVGTQEQVEGFTELVEALSDNCGCEIVDRMVAEQIELDFNAPIEPDVACSI